MFDIRPTNTISRTDQVLGFACKPFESEAIGSKYPNGYVLVLFKNGHKKLLSRTVLRNIVRGM